MAIPGPISMQNVTSPTPVINTIYDQLNEDKRTYSDHPPHNDISYDSQYSATDTSDPPPPDDTSYDFHYSATNTLNHAFDAGFEVASDKFEGYHQVGCEDYVAAYTNYNVDKNIYNDNNDNDGNNFKEYGYDKYESDIDHKPPPY